MYMDNFLKNIVIPINLTSGFKNSEKIGFNSFWNNKFNIYTISNLTLKKIKLNSNFSKIDGHLKTIQDKYIIYNIIADLQKNDNFIFNFDVEYVANKKNELIQNKNELIQENFISTNNNLKCDTELNDNLKCDTELNDNLKCDTEINDNIDVSKMLDLRLHINNTKLRDTTFLEIRNSFIKLNLLYKIEYYNNTYPLSIVEIDTKNMKDGNIYEFKSDGRLESIGCYTKNLKNGIFIKFNDLVLLEYRVFQKDIESQAIYYNPVSTSNQNSISYLIEYYIKTTVITPDTITINKNNKNLYFNVKKMEGIYNRDGYLSDFVNKNTINNNIVYKIKTIFDINNNPYRYLLTMNDTQYLYNIDYKPVQVYVQTSKTRFYYTYDSDGNMKNVYSLKNKVKNGLNIDFVKTSVINTEIRVSYYIDGLKNGYEVITNSCNNIKIFKYFQDGNIVKNNINKIPHVDKIISQSRIATDLGNENTIVKYIIKNHGLIMLNNLTSNIENNDIMFFENQD